MGASSPSSTIGTARQTRIPVSLHLRDQGAIMSITALKDMHLETRLGPTMGPVAIVAPEEESFRRVAEVLCRELRDRLNTQAKLVVQSPRAHSELPSP